MSLLSDVKEIKEKLVQYEREFFKKRPPWDDKKTGKINNGILLGYKLLNFLFAIYKISSDLNLILSF